MVRFDAYTATADDLDQSQALSWLFSHGDVMTEGRGHHGFASRIAVKDETGSEVGSFSWGGKHTRAMLEVKGERTPTVVEALRACSEHRCTRADSCADFDAPGAFESLLAPLQEITKAHDLYSERRGDWDLHPELGRTYYVGSPASAVRARLYEKGRQPEYRHLGLPSWVRLEIQVRPQKQARESFATLGPLDVWGASKWTRQVAVEVLKEHIDPHPPGTVRKQTSDDAAIQWMAKQYGPALIRKAAALGSWQVLGLALRDLITQQLQGQDF